MGREGEKEKGISPVISTLYLMQEGGRKEQKKSQGEKGTSWA